MSKKTGRGMKSSVAFLITFLVFLVLFGGVMIWGVAEFWQQNYGTADEPQPQPTEAPAVRPNHTLLLITEEAGGAQGFVVLSAEPALARVRVIPVPRETTVTVGVKQSRLFEMYLMDGIPAVTAQISNLLGMDIDHYAVLTYQNLQKYVTYLGDGLIYTLPENISYESAAGTVNMKSGARTLSAAQTVDLLHYTGWHSGRRGCANAQGEIVAALIDQYFVASRFDEADTDFGTLINLVRSDILTSQFAAARDDLYALARHNERNVSVLCPPKGEFVGVGDAMRFEMAEAPLG